MSDGEDRVMDIKGAKAWLNERGYGYSFRQVTRMANERKLPFRPGPDGRKLFIWQSQLAISVDYDLRTRAATK